jgi:tetratricopeptide (TPR) repeat protein
VQTLFSQQKHQPELKIMKNRTLTLLTSNVILITTFTLLLSFSINANESYLTEAKQAFESGQIEAAETSIEKALKINPNDVDVLFMAGRIAGQRAQQANIFSRLGYARDSKRYFTKALEINPKHKSSIIGLIRFHQQAPVMAGGDKEAVFEFIDVLRSVDKRTAFPIEAPLLLQNEQFDLAKRRFEEALKSSSGQNKSQFLFDSAMVFSSYGHYQEALKHMLSIDMSNESTTSSFADMRLYQLGKLAAETRSNLDLGYESMKQYSQLPEKNKTIPQDWVEFRLVQIQFLKNPNTRDSKPFLKIQSSTSDDSLKEKIRSFLNQMKS